MRNLRKGFSVIKYILPYGLLVFGRAAYAECRELLLKKRGNWFIPQRNSDECIVIANGPSLKKNRDEIIRLSKKCDVITLNFSIDDDIFFETNSFMHVIADPLFFDFPDHGEVHTRFSGFYDRINSLERKLILAVPHTYYSVVMKRIKNDNITLLSYPVRQLSSYNAFSRYRMHNGLIGFGAQTVTLSSLYLALIAGYKKILIIGFDLSNVYYVDKYCRIYSTLKSFNRERKFIYHGDEYYHEYILIPDANVYISLLKIKEYAAKNCIQIINLSEESKIDVFPKGSVNGEIFPFKPKEEQVED